MNFSSILKVAKSVVAWLFWISLFFVTIFLVVVGQDVMTQAFWIGFALLQYYITIRFRNNKFVFYYMLVVVIILVIVVIAALMSNPKKRSP